MFAKTQTTDQRGRLGREIHIGLQTKYSA